MFQSYIREVCVSKQSYILRMCATCSMYIFLVNWCFKAKLHTKYVCYIREVCVLHMRSICFKAKLWCYVITTFDRGDPEMTSMRDVPYNLSEYDAILN